jgi:distribution and morphology protein 31
MRSPSEFCSHQEAVLSIRHPITTNYLAYPHLLACPSPASAAAIMPGVSTARHALRAMPRAGPSRQLVTRSAQSDRYTAIHAFFTRQALSVTPPKFSTRTLLQRRWNSTNKPQEGCENCSERRPTTPPKTPPPPSAGRQDHAQDYTPFIKRLIASSKVLQSGSPHRPSKEQLLAAASGWWQRLRIRIKWFTIRGWRRFNTDDFSAFASWFVVGNSESEVLI